MNEHSQYGWDPKEKEIRTPDFISTPSVARTDKDLIVKDFYNFTNVEFQQLRGQKLLRTGVSTTYSTALNQYLIGVTSLALAPTIGLPKPSLAGKGKTYVIKDEAGGATTTTITVVSQGEETIDGATSFSISTNYQSVSFYTDGANWFIY